LHVDRITTKTCIRGVERRNVTKFTAALSVINTWHKDLASKSKQKLMRSYKT